MDKGHGSKPLAAGVKMKPTGKVTLSSKLRVVADPKSESC